jgi:hypothetical protein
VLVAVFLQTAPHVAAGLVPSKSSCAHVTISVVAGVTRAAMVDMLVVICGAQSEFSKPMLILGSVKITQQWSSGPLRVRPIAGSN